MATDPSAEMLAVLRSKAERQNLPIQTVRGRMQDVSGSAQFDIALCVFTVLLYVLDETALNASIPVQDRITTSLPDAPTVRALS